MPRSCSEKMNETLKAWFTIDLREGRYREGDSSGEAARASLHRVRHLAEVFEVRACVIKSSRGASKLSLQEIQMGSAANNSIVQTRSRLLFFKIHPEVVWYHEGGCRSACPNLHPVSGSFSCVCPWKVRCRASV